MEVQVFNRHRPFLKVYSGLSLLLFLVGYYAYVLVDKELLVSKEICPENPLFLQFVHGIVQKNILIEVIFHLGTLLYTLILFSVWHHETPRGTVHFLVKCTLLLAGIHFCLCAIFFYNFQGTIEAFFSGVGTQYGTCKIHINIARQLTKIKGFLIFSLGSFVLVIRLIFEVLGMKNEVRGVDN